MSRSRLPWRSEKMRSGRVSLWRTYAYAAILYTRIAVSSSLPGPVSASGGADLRPVHALRRPPARAAAELTHRDPRPTIPFLRPEWRNGRRSGLKIRRGQPRGGSTPPSGTIYGSLRFPLFALTRGAFQVPQSVDSRPAF